MQNRRTNAAAGSCLKWLSTGPGTRCSCEQWQHLFWTRSSLPLPTTTAAGGDRETCPWPLQRHAHPCQQCWGGEPERFPVNNPPGCIFPEHINSQLPSGGDVAALHSSPTAVVPQGQPELRGEQPYQWMPSHIRLRVLSGQVGKQQNGAPQGTAAFASVKSAGKHAPLPASPASPNPNQLPEAAAQR